MVYRKLLVLAVFGFGSGMLSAATPWFDAGIKDYESWPTDGSDMVVTGAGTWSNTVDAKLEGVEGQRMLAIDSIQSVTFSSAVSKTVADQGSAGVLVTTRVRFSVCEDLPEIAADQKGSLTVLNDGEGLSYRGLVANAEGTANVWAKLTGAVPKEDDFVSLEVSIRRGAAGLNQIRYVIDGVALLNNGAEWSDIVFPADDDQVTGCAYTGNGTVAALSGAAGEAAGPMQLLTIPALENISVAHVKVAGVEILPNAEGKYAVEKGALVTVTFAPASGWALDVSTMSFVVCDDMTLPETGRPNAINVAAAIVINEVMAKNGVTLKTKKGYAELDWVELHNKGDEDADLSGWYFYNDPTAKKSKWTLLQGDCVVPAKGYKIVWCDKDMLCPDDGFAADEAFVRFNISTSAGKTLFLATPEGDITTQLPLPGGIKDISYGLGHLSRTLVAQNAAAQYKVGDGDWKDVDGAIGMSATESGFEVTEYSIGKQVSNMDVAEACLLDSSTWKSAPVTTRQETLAFASNGSTGNFSDYAAFPTFNADDTILVAKGTVLIPESGDWSFAVGSDDGFTAKLTRLGQSWSWESRGARSYAQSVASFNLEAGAYDVEIVYFNRSGGRIVDFSAAKGQIAFDAAKFSLVGTGSVVHAGALGAQIAADLTDEMVGKETTATWKTTFTIDEVPAAADTLRLLMRYADGFTAKLNGETVASATVAGKRTPAEALMPVAFTIPATKLVQGANTLEIVGTNDAIDDGDFLLAPELKRDIADDVFVYSPTPTPGAKNAADGKTGFTPVVTFSEPHGWKEAAFDLTLSCAENPTAVIYYTLDGTAPVVGAEGTFRYDAPITVDKTTVVRAAVPDVDSILQQDASATYLFLADVLKQSATPPEGYPADKAVNSQAVRYGMNKLITEGDADTQARLRKGFTESVATVSLVIDPKHLFDKSSGIYVNASGNGRGWERPTMVEQIDPTGACDFNVPAGIRIRGAYSRGAGYPKHSFRLFFRSEYGMGTLEQPLFGDEGDDKFEKIDLRTEQNYSWANGSEWETFVHEVFARDSQRDMGETYNRSRYLHLFINGIYWGLYQTEERVDQNYCESYNGGVAENYDVVRTSQPGYNTGVVEGESAAWETLWRITTKEGYGEGHEANYNKVLGLNPDGTPNPEYPVLLNVTNLITYMITSQFAADKDSPVNSSGMANNIIAFRNRVPGEGQREGFLWNRHDAEHSLSRGAGANSGKEALLYGTRGGANKSLDIGNFNPAELHYELCQNAEYRRVFADLVYRHLLKTGGAMTAPVAEARFRARMAELDDAIVCETARWGNGSTKRTRTTWLNNCNDAIKFINQRTPYLIQAYRDLGWYPTVNAAAVIDGAGAPVSEGATVAADASLYFAVPADATAYYTTDGSDPLAAGGTPSASALAYSGASPVPVETPVFTKGSEWKYYDAGDKPATNWTAADYDAASWKSGNGRLGFANSGSFGTTLARYVGGGSSGTQVTTYYFRKSFTLPKGAEALTTLKASLDCDDGYIAYVNGTEVGRDQVSSDAYEAFSTATNMGEKETTWTFPAGTLKEGENVIAVEVHQCNASSSDAWWDLALAYFAPGNVEGGLSVPTAGLTLNVRVLKDGEWSALETVSVLGEMPKATPVEALRVAEIMSSSASKLDSDDYLVLTNVADGVVNLEGVKIVAWNAKKNSESKPSLTYLFGTGERLMPGEALTLTNLDKLTNSQVGLRIYDAEGTLVQDCFVDADWWNSACDESGVSFVPRTYGAELKTIDDWKPSVSWVERALRFYAFDGIPADGNGGDTGEYVVLTNISDTVTLDLTGVVVNIGKADDMAVDESTSKCLFTLGEMTLAPNASVRLDQATYWNGKKQKITNGALVMKIYDAEGACAQVSTVDQNDAAFANYKAKASGAAAGPVLKATSFARELTTSDWTEYVPPAPQDWPEDPDTEIADTAVASDLGITSGAFATATPAELRKLSKWAKTHTVPYAGEAVNAMSFASPTVFEEAYLLNCAPDADAVAQKKAAFRFAEIVPGVEPTVEGDFNGTVRVLGAETLEGPWTEDNADAHFFKATLAR